MAGFASGFIRSAVGYHMLALLSAAVAAVLLIVAGNARRRVPVTALGFDGN
jgi:hypothetical protein